MKKLMLNLDALKVETFEPEVSVSMQPGSVAAHLASELDLDCPTYDWLDLRCHYSIPYRPGGVCTPVCGVSVQCLPTENIEDCG